MEKSLTGDTPEDRHTHLVLVICGVNRIFGKQKHCKITLFLFTSNGKLPLESVPEKYRRPII
jgi:hypothetical protein